MDISIGRLLPLVGRIAPSIRLSLYQRLVLLMLSVMTIVCISLVAIVRQNISSPNPFLDYSAIFPGQKWNSKTALGFSCPPTDATVNVNYCNLSPTSGPFWYVDLVTHEGIVTSVTFAVRNGALSVGDLAVLWGKPNIQIFQGSGLFKWSSLHISADGIIAGRGFSYYFPLAHVTFSTKD